MSRQLFALFLGLLLTFMASAQDKLPFNTEEITRFDEPWSMAFLPDGRMLVTEKKGRLLIVSQQGEKSLVGGAPDVDYGGQGGLGDVALHPDFANNKLVYLSYAEAGVGGVRGAAVARGTLVEEGRRAQLQNLQVIWRQYPKVLGYGHYGHRILFDNDKYLWISSGDRQKFTPAQDMQSSMGKVLRLYDDGSVPKDNPFVNYRQENPFVDGEAIYQQIWSLGHRNPLGMAFDLNGKLWVIEMGPAGGDELNLIKRAANYGYPEVSNGKHYDGRPIPDHDTEPQFAAPAISWTPVISPADMIVYRGNLFADWRGDALVAGLTSQGIVHIKFDGERATEAARYAMGARIRKVTEGPDGALWVLEDERAQSEGRLLKLTPKRR
ncbi:PQQ-dependent sugar dehydrogenase [Arsukibacterium sp.]|uniref:PQQ-dependent sugar dehydrogenase n=1 Tax=Arsukibacterium sp. TaxID=1977258 RepID=UPI00299DDD46|nr:PQQ-dependent sugar dehydrogenase [Arsukibacterium sp.]MDX1539170.1 PQQ-dependent sugar dehydrogenase [Arsukibacterium sp.]